MPTRDLNMTAGAPALGQMAQGLSQPTGGIDMGASQAFNQRLMGLLTQHQSMGTAPFMKQSFDAQQMQADRIAAPTPQSLIGAAPSVQSGVRQASAAALNPTVQGAQQSAQTFSEQLSGFGNILNFARQIGSDYQQAQERAQDRALSQIFNVINTYGGQGFTGLGEDELKQLEKTAGLPTGFLARIQNITPTAQQITPYQQATLDLQRQELAQGNQITPYQQASLDLQRQQLNQPMTLGAGQTVYDPVTGQAKYTAPAVEKDEQLYGNADNGYFTYKNGALTPVRVALPGGTYIESGTGRTVTYSDEIDPNKFYIEMGTGANIQGSSLRNVSKNNSGQTCYITTIGGEEYEVCQ